MGALIVHNANDVLGYIPGSCILELIMVRQLKCGGDAQGQKAAQIQFTFRIVNHPDWDGPGLADLTIEHPGPESRLAEILKALNAGVPVPDGKVNLQSYLGRRMRAAVRRTDSGNYEVEAWTLAPLER